MTRNIVEWGWSEDDRVVVVPIDGRVGDMDGWTGRSLDTKVGNHVHVERQLG